MSVQWFPLRLNTTTIRVQLSPSCLRSVHIMNSGNGVGFTQLALFGGGMYFELLVYIPEASTLGFSEAVDPPLFLPTLAQFSFGQSQAVKALIFFSVRHYVMSIRLYTVHHTVLRLTFSTLRPSS
ncbi:hypothetical protein Tco_0660102 [Tanacetum coccineum]